jgi:hypothetical protein
MAEERSPARLYVDDFPPELKREFHKSAIDAGLTMKQAAVAAIENWVADRKAVGAAFEGMSEREDAGHGG